MSVLNKEVLSSEKILEEYKNQQGCERGFRFIKDPMFLASYVFVKNPERVEVIGAVCRESGTCGFEAECGRATSRSTVTVRRC